jgi:hypothetical protein
MIRRRFNTTNEQSTEIKKLAKPNISRRWTFVAVLAIITLAGFAVLHSQSTSRQDYELQEKSHQRLRKKEKIVKAKIAAEAAKHFPTTHKNDLLILYAYFETADSRQNIVHFFSDGLHSKADFIIIINGDSNVDELLPQNIPNIKVIRRDNSCFDLGSHGEVLRMNDYELVKMYRKFILMNGSVRGPFLPTYVDACWSDLFLKKITDEVKLVGTTYNYWEHHIQSMVLATDSIGLEILLAGNETDTSSETDPDYKEHYTGNPKSLVGLSRCPTSKFGAVSAEISISKLIRRAGYKIAVLMTSATSQIFRGWNDTQSDYLTFPTNSYNLASVHPYEVIFIKARKGWGDSMDPLILTKLTEWHDHMNYSSWQACKV